MSVVSRRAGSVSMLLMILLGMGRGSMTSVVVWVEPVAAVAAAAADVAADVAAACGPLPDGTFCICSRTFTVSNGFEKQTKG